MNNHQLIEKFYTAFASGNAEEMVSCYDDNIQFHDPAFGPLKGEEAKNMWRMLVERSKGRLEITYKNIEANENIGSVSWEASYIFRQTGRAVKNKINTQFEFKDGKIIKHNDEFNMWSWSRQALGFKGLLLGWSGFMRSKIRAQAINSLKNYRK